MKVIGVAGKKRHGKDTIADAIERFFVVDARLLDFRVHRDSFAAPIRQFSSSIFGDVEKEEPVEWLDGKTKRQFEQVLGTEVGRQYHPDLWVRMFRRRAEFARADYAIASDVRFPNEADACDFLIHVHRPGFESDDGHESESYDLRERADVCLVNNGTVDELQMSALLSLGSWIFDSH